MWRVSVALLALLVLGMAWLVAFGDLFKPGSDLGYNLGLAGGLMMLSLLLYPLRKRVRALDRLGRMDSWFRYHMFMGMGGPLLILFHSTFRTGSMNGSIALYAMLLVALSGMVGRFVYRHIHNGLYGRALTLSELEAEFKARQESIGSVFSLQPDIEKRLKEFHQLAFAELHSTPRRFWRFMTLRHKGKKLSRSVRHDAKKILAAEAKKQNWPYAQLMLNYSLAKRHIDDYIYAIIRLAQLSSWVKLFSLWHVAHVPFIYLLVFSGIAHVVAVHLY
ncbi:hypothetical protein SKTS_13200 [Sulfurimicrobium lacus]|uniref:Uncharacterized protein n=2 Tax=Sulfurimicrobium lacus TaxID=2715678 RepID=A0A6F8V9U8_9PROT|nr:hypothetical protein SKTS_13200 [Sulfurimicrobium lacus]